MARVERGDIGVGELGLALELGTEPLVDWFARAVEHPQREAERPHVLAAQRILIAEAEWLDRLDRLRADVEGEHVPLGEAAVLDRVGFVLRLIEIALGEIAGVGDHQPAGLERVEIGFQRRRVHRHQHIGRVTRGVDPAAAEVDLEGADAEQRALRGADLGGEIGEGGEIVARQRGGECELPPGKLHPVTRVAGETHHHGFGSIHRLARRFDRLGRHSHSSSRPPGRRYPGNGGLGPACRPGNQDFLATPKNAHGKPRVCC